MRHAPLFVALWLPWTCSGVCAAAEPTLARGSDEVTRAPRPLQAEVGQFLGVLFPSPRHNFHDERRSHSRLSPVALLAGARAAFLPLTWLGLEADASVAPSSTEDGRGATIWSARAHLLGQLPHERWVAFLLAGGGRMGVRSDVLDDDADPLIQFGAGVKYAVGRIVVARLDVRDGLTQKDGASAGALTHHVELTLGFSYRLPRASAAPGPRRAKGGEVEAGSARDGSAADTDGDGVTGDRDRCPREAETKNGYEDEDGCADGGQYLSFSPEGDGSWLGTLRGVEFEPGSDALRASSHAALEELTRTLESAGTLKVRLTLRESELRDPAANQTLAARRLEALVGLLVSKGIDRARIETVGVAAELTGPGASPPEEHIFIEPIDVPVRR